MERVLVGLLKLLNCFLMNISGDQSSYFDVSLFWEMEEIGKMGMYEYEVDKDIFRASANFRRMFELPEHGALSGEVIRSILHPDDLERVLNLLEHCLQTSQPFNTEYRCLINGELKYIRSRSKVVSDAGGRAIKMIGVKQDISEDKKVEEQLRKSRRTLLTRNQELEGLFRHSSVGMALFEAQPSYRVIAHNKVYQEFWPEPFRSEGVKGKGLWEYVPQLEESGIIEIFEEVKRSRKSKVIDDFMYDGLPRGRTWWEWSLSPVIVDDEVIAFAHVLVETTRALGDRQRLEREIAEREEAEKALRHNEKKLYLALAAAKAGTFDIPIAQQEPIVVSQSVKGLFGFPPEADTDFSDYMQRVHPHDIARVKKTIESSIAEKKGHQINYRVIHGDGRQVWISSRAEPVMDEQGEVERLIGTLMDYTQNKEWEEDLVRSREETELRSKEIENIYDTAPIGLCVLDKDLRFMRINERLAEINGFSVEQHLGKTIRNMLPDLADEVEPLLHRVMETGEPLLDITLKGETPSQPGVERTWIESWYPFRNRQGHISGISIVAEEVTEKVKSDELRQVSEERYKKLFNSIDDGFCVCEMLLNDAGKAVDYRFLEVNHTFEAHTGLADATGRTALELVPGLEQEWIDTYAKVGIEEQSIRFEQGSDKMGRWFDVYAFPFGASGSRVFAIQFKDISKQKKREQELVEIKEKLAQANKELLTSNKELKLANNQLRIVNKDLDNFVYTASHDLKSPISNIYGLLELMKTELKEVEVSPTAFKILGMMESSVDRFMSTIANLTDIARLQKEAIQPEEDVNLREVLDDVLLDLRMSIEQSDAEIRIEVDDGYELFFSPKNLRSIVYNLISNAIKYRHPKRKPLVHVHCRELAGHHLLTVEDNGLGMKLRQDKPLFTMFRRLHSHVEGSGVGLYIVKKILDNSDGKIEVESEVNKGTTFRVYFKK
jgi:PAS domain S-box-containing protein